MADLTIPTPDFVAGTVIVSSEVDANNSAITTYINNKQNGTVAFDQVKSAAQIQAQPLTNQLLLGNPSAFNTIITAPAPAATRTVTLPDAGANSSFILTTSGSAQTISSQLIAKGTATNDSAAAGYIGEYMSSEVLTGSAVSSTGTNQYFDITNIVLTAGDWDLTAMVYFLLNGATVTVAGGGPVNQSGNNNPSGVDNGRTLPPTTVCDTMVTVRRRVSISGSETWYLKGFYTFSAGTPKAYGRIVARRMR